MTQKGIIVKIIPKYFSKLKSSAFTFEACLEFQKELLRKANLKE